MKINQLTKIVLLNLILNFNHCITMDKNNNVLYVIHQDQINFDEFLEQSKKNLEDSKKQLKEIESPNDGLTLDPETQCMKITLLIAETSDIIDQCNTQINQQGDYLNNNQYLFFFSDLIENFIKQRQKAIELSLDTMNLCKAACILGIKLYKSNSMDKRLLNILKNQLITIMADKKKNLESFSIWEPKMQEIIDFQIQEDAITLKQYTQE
jgi:hypothetical protein